MNAITITNLSDETNRALVARAERNGTTAEAEAERILNEAFTVVTPNYSPPEEGLVEAFQRLREKYPELEEIEFSRDQTPAWVD